MRHIAVDLGDVVCKVDFTNFKKMLSVSLNIGLDDAEYFLNRCQKLHDLGLTSLNDELRDHFKIKSEPLINGLIKEWNKTISINKTMKEFLKELIAKGTKVALLSNIGINHSTIIEETLGNTISNNSIKFFSCRVGVRKPSLLYYKTFLDLYPDFKGCLYIDDRQENLDTGKEFGFVSTHFQLSAMNEAQLEEKLNYFRSL